MHCPLSTTQVSKSVTLILAASFAGVDHVGEPVLVAAGQSGTASARMWASRSKRPPSARLEIHEEVHVTRSGHFAAGNGAEHTHAERAPTRCDVQDRPTRLPQGLKVHRHGCIVIHQASVGQPATMHSIIHGDQRFN